MESIDTPEWKIINTFFADNPHFISSHHLNSYNEFFSSGVQKIFKENNPIYIFKEELPDKTHRYKCNVYIGGLDGDKIYYGKPIIYDEDNQHYMYPNEARLRNMTYGVTIHYDVLLDMTYRWQDGNGEYHEVKKVETIERVYLGKFPIMLQSNLCILKGLDPEVRFRMGECRDDPGGYFIIQGKEKVILSQEKFADNTFYIRDKFNDNYSHSAEIRTVSDDTSKPQRTLSVRIRAPSETMHNGQIVVNVPNIRIPVPLFILMRALGIESDRDIIRHCLLDMEKYDDLIEYFRPSIHDAGNVFTQEEAIKFLSTFIKGKSVADVLYILRDYLLPQIGEMNFKNKAFYLGYIVKRLLLVYTKKEPPTDRDNYKFKRIEDSGSLIAQLFSEYYKLQLNKIYYAIDSKLFFKSVNLSVINETNRQAQEATDKDGIGRIAIHKEYQGENFFNLISDNKKEFFDERIVEEGFRKGFKGNWGSSAHTKRIGLVQDLNRLSFFSFLSHLRKIILPMDSSLKIVKPRLCHSTQWGIICPVHTPDGGNVGFHKHMALFTQISSVVDSRHIKTFLLNNGVNPLEMYNVKDCALMNELTKVMVNGAWFGLVALPSALINTFKLLRRNGIIEPFVSIQWNIELGEIVIYTDAGRPYHPVLPVANGVVSIDETYGKKILSNDKKELTWRECIYGGWMKDFVAKGGNAADKASQILSKPLTPEIMKELKTAPSIIEFMDTQEAENMVLPKTGTDPSQYLENRVTHREIHPSAILGVMANQTIFPENNQFPRNLFSCGQSKQAASIYSSNFQNRIDTAGLVLTNGETPLVKSRYYNYITKERHPYGENAIVAVMCYSGYNVEDALIFNESAVNRGLFHTTYYKNYETHEEIKMVNGVNVVSEFNGIEGNGVLGLKPNYDYSKLDPKMGTIKENTKVDDKTILIGMATNDPENRNVLMDSSVKAKKGLTGFVDKSFVTRGEKGTRIAKVRIREERIPSMGDKFCSRAGQKGTVGIILPESDMPFTEDGIRPDLIVNPHAFPSRMTIGHLIETLMAKNAALYGGFGDCTAFENKGIKDKEFGKMLEDIGYHSSGNEIMYNGMTGEQLNADIYLGPTYYLRLKHMVKDKINYRARGPRTVLTRQTVQGRANNGGLRIGEMDRDVLIGHGMSKFLNESMMVRGDEYFMAICNQSGTIAIYNETQNVFISPMADGPIQFSGNDYDKTLGVVHKTKFGRDFSIVRVPYAFKLLYQELQALNVQMRIITEDNVDTLSPLIQSDEVKYRGNTIDINRILGKKVQEIREIEKQAEAIFYSEEKEIVKGVNDKPTEDYWLKPDDADDEVVSTAFKAVGSVFRPSTPDFGPGEENPLLDNVDNVDNVGKEEAPISYSPVEDDGPRTPSVSPSEPKTFVPRTPSTSPSEPKTFAPRTPSTSPSEPKTFAPTTPSTDIDDGDEDESEKDESEEDEIKKITETKNIVITEKPSNRPETPDFDESDESDESDED